MLLNSGDIPNIFDNEERLEIIDKMQQKAQADNAKVEISPLTMYNMFTEGVRRLIIYFYVPVLCRLLCICHTGTCTSS